MNDALIGHTGFVGSTLARARSFGATFNSTDIATIDGRTFDTVICAGVTAVKWRANQQPGPDRAAIQSLQRHLETITAAHFILVSTIDVYRDPAGVTEADIPPTEGLHPYGLHRLELESFVAARFPHTIIRLPGLFGPGLKKNLIFDLMHHHQTDRITPAGSLQWYPLRRFPADLAQIEAAAPPLLNLAVEPIVTKDIQARLFPGTSLGPETLPAPHYDMRTLHSGILGATGPYHLQANQVLDELAHFIADPS